MATNKATDAERRRADRNRLEQAARALLSSEGWHHWVRVRATNGLARYSLANCHATAGRNLRRGLPRVPGAEPMCSKGRARDADPRTDGRPSRRARGSIAGGRGDTEEPIRMRFAAVPVFDVSQTGALPDKEPVPLHPPSEPIGGATHAHLLAPLRQLATELGCKTDLRPLDGAADGWCDSETKQIVINGALSANAQVRLLVHEIAHALGLGYSDYGRRQAEVLVDTVTFVVCGSVAWMSRDRACPTWPAGVRPASSTRFATTQRRSASSPGVSNSI
jgi:hypothetical protein